MLKGTRRTRMTATGAIAAVALVGCKTAPTTPVAGGSGVDAPLRTDVTDIRPMAHATLASADANGGYEPVIYDTTGPVPIAPPPAGATVLPTPTAAPTHAAAPVKATDVMFTDTPDAQATPIAKAAHPSKSSKAKPVLLKSAAHRTHIVRHGDTWFAIARATYGDGAQWHRLAAANPQVNGTLKVGQTITLP